ncbi:MAG: proteinase inhibitor [Bradymonadia bacterium]
MSANLKMWPMVLAFSALTLAGCDDEDEGPRAVGGSGGAVAGAGGDVGGAGGAAAAGGAVGGEGGGAAGAGGAGGDVGGAGGGGEATMGRCEYTNPFSRGIECKQYTGAGWTLESAQADCGAVFANAVGTFEAGASCGYEAELGRCVVGDAEAEGYLLINAGDDAGQCGLAQTGCETFAMGSFTPGDTCATGDLCEAPVVDDGIPAFIQPYQICKDPLPGEPAGQGPDGQVCTHVLVSACTEPGRRYDEYASCDDVITQRGWTPQDIPVVDKPDDPRMNDEAYLADLAWVKEEIEACACVCCHSSRVKPEGASAWDIEAGTLWIDNMADTGLAMMAGLADSTSFGNYEPEDNNGFDRSVVGTPTTDNERMRAFLVKEFLDRGYTEEQGAEVPPFGGPLYSQAEFSPEPCEKGEGVDAEGIVKWSGGGARYVYILEADAENPGVYPNFVRPEGTLWQIEVPDTDGPIGCGMRYGEAPEGTRQMVPAEGEAPALVPGETYYLVALKDIVLPLSRCTFVYEGP